MTLVPLTTCGLALGVDPKTLRLWLKAAQVSCCAHPADARLKCLTLPQLEQLAQAHGRPLSALLPEAVPAGATGLESSVPSPLQEDSAARQQLAVLAQQVAILQAQVTDLALAVLSLRAAPGLPAPLAPQAASPLPEAEPVPPSDPAPGDPAPVPASPRRRTRALPLIQVGADGRVVVIAPTQGVLALVPDSPAWFAWLSSIESFSFESPAGRYSATRRVRHGQRVQAWYVHCSLHGRSCSLYLGLNSTLTLARLQQMVTAARDRLAP